MEVIGFGGTYYTLWEKLEENLYPYYIKRISKSLEKAKTLYPNAEVDLSLQGQKWEVRPECEKVEIPETHFQFGKYKETPIAECEDISYVDWYFVNTQSPEAEKVLIQNGYKKLENIYFAPDEYKIKKLKSSGQDGHYFEDKTRVDLELKEIDSFHFDGFYGTTWIITYIDNNNRFFYYKGSSIPNITNRQETRRNGIDDFVTVTATIKHGYYNGIEKTYLQRIKVK